MALRPVLVRGLLLVLAIFCGRAIAQCDGAWVATGGIAGPGGDVNAVVVWDPDGDGPARPLLVAGGHFSIAGNAVASNIAAWDGVSWHALGQRLNGDVKALAVCYGRLVAGGSFLTANGLTVNQIAQWDGMSWQPMGAGSSQIVRAMTVYNGHIVAAGSFGAAGLVAMWDGVSWVGLGEQAPATVTSLTQFGGVLVAGGAFTAAGGQGANHIAQWDGVSWGPVGAGLSSQPNAMMVFGGELFCAGAFTSGPFIYDAKPLVRWDGAAWQVVAGLPMPYGQGFGHSLGVFNGSLVIGAATSSTSGPQYVSRWDGASWHQIGPSLSNISSVSSLIEFDGSLVVNGSITFDGTEWVSPDAYGALGLVTAAFSSSQGLIIASSRVSGTSVLRKDGDTWTPLGSLPSGMGVEVLGEFNGEIIAGGSVNGAAAKIVRWDGAAWLQMGVWPYYNVHAFAVYNGDLIAAGGQWYGGLGAVMRWDGSAWQSMATDYGGLEGGQVYALAVYEGDLVAAGSFSFAAPNYHTINNIARLADGTWQEMPHQSTSTTPVNALAVYNGSLVAAGTLNNGSVGAVYVWNGASWDPLAPGQTYNVSRLAVYNGELLMGGDFGSVAGVAASRIARWNGAVVRAFGSGINGIPNAMVDYQGDLIVTGGFTIAGGKPSASLAWWTRPSADFDRDGSPGTDRDMEAFFACLSGDCCASCGSADFNGDGDVGTDQDIDAFFRVLAGGSC